MIRTRNAAAAAVALIVLSTGGCQTVQNLAHRYGMSFFVTSKGSGKGADFGGLSGADAHCQALAAAVGADKARWRAYLSTQGSRGEPTQHARDRIGSGPWQNAKGVLIAQSVEDLHGANKLNKETALTENGEMVNGRSDSPNMHDILTGSQSDGRAVPGAADTTCGNWTRSGSTGSAIVGHHDRMGLSDDAASKSWNSSHATKGCSEEALRSTGGAGLIYCFATFN
jgi:hypothetical protein